MTKVIDGTQSEYLIRHKQQYRRMDKAAIIKRIEDLDPDSTHEFIITVSLKAK